MNNGNTTKHGLTLVYDKSTEKTTCELFKALGDKKEAEAKKIIKENFEGKLVPFFQITSSENPVELSPLAFVAKRVKSEPIFRMLLGFAETKHFVHFFSDQNKREITFDRISVHFLLDEVKTKIIEDIAKTLKNTPQNLNFLHFKECVVEEINKFQKKQKTITTEVNNFIRVNCLSELVASYLLPELPQILK
jgi:hypothetical protein